MTIAKQAMVIITVPIVAVVPRRDAAWGDLLFFYITRVCLGQSVNDLVLRVLLLIAGAVLLIQHTI